MWIHELNLIQQTYDFDEIGNQVPTEVKASIFCDVKSVSRSEFYTAAVNGLKPVIVFVVHNYEYNGQRLVEFEEKKYKIIRTYSSGTEEIELTCEKV